MNLLLATFFLFGSVYDEVGALLKQVEQNVLITEDLNFLSQLDITTPKQSDCQNCRQAEILDSKEPEVMVFMSFSVPLESWKDWSVFLENHRGVFILKGLPGNSFHSFAEKISACRRLGIKVPILIDPKKFKENNVGVVPTCIALINGNREKIEGNCGTDKILFDQPR